ncbi:cystein desulfurase NifS [Candidatus Termititenax dinenymphae]|uniref:cysteine desulfurase n=1 Tax=Candidatus Termititenax dinenymphae TaxID=2218523 RepID=A0A388TLB4_9BACT|nr:cystein desulfurase NifS [Candidatus Termititenax dinenymphae]
MKRVYLDNNATTMTSLEAAKEMVRFNSINYGNPSSLHNFGLDTRPELRKAMDRIYALINAADEDDVLITSGATEANNHVIKSVFYANTDTSTPLSVRKNHYITTNLEHPTVYNTFQYLEKLGAKVTVLPSDNNGLISAEQVKKALTDQTVLVSIMLANNEIGTILPIKEITKLCHANGILIHTDATQAIGKFPVDVQDLGVDYLSFSAHKFHGPKGIGGLYVRKGKRLEPLFHGGEQMASLRAGTLNVPGIVGMGVAAQEAVASLEYEATEVKRLRDKLENFILKNIPDTFLNGDKVKRTPNTLNIAFKDCEGEALLWDLNEHGIAASTGSACASEELESSRILRALGIDKALSHMAVRFSLSRYTTEEEIDYVISVLPGIIKRLREVSLGR